MKHTLLLLLFVTQLVVTDAGASSKPAAKPPPLVSSLSIERIENIYIAQNLVTTISLKTERLVDKISIGSNIVDVQFDPNLKQIELRALVTDGATNMNIVIDGKVYRFVIGIVSDNRRTFAHTYTLPGEVGAEDEEGFSMGTNAPPVRPDRIDVVSLITTAERAQIDPQFRRTVAGLYVKPVSKTYVWNYSPVTLQDVSYFSEADILLVRIELFNKSDKALYLHSKQYRLFAGVKEVPITVRTQLSATVFPGQLDKVYLVVQGLRIDPRNEWELGLPPDGDAVRRMLNSQGAPQ